MDHDSQEERVTASKRKTKARKSGRSVLDKAKALGVKADVYSLAVYWEPTHKEYRLAVHVPDGWDLPDVNELIDAALSGRTRSRLRHRRGAHQTSSEPPHQAVHRVKTAATGQRQAVRRSSRQRARRSTPQSSRAVTPDVNTPWSPDQASDDASLASPSCSPVVDPAGQEGLPPWSLGEGEGQHAAEQPAVEADGALSVGLGDVSPRLLGWPPPVQQADAMDVQELTGWAHEAPVESSSCHPVLPIPDGVDQTPGDALPVFDPPGGTPYLDLDFLGDLSHNRPCEEFETRDLLGSDMPPVDTGRQKTATPRPAPNMAWWALAREFLELLEQILSSRSTSHSPGTGVASGVS